MSSHDPKEVEKCIHMLMVAANNANDLIHESVAVNNATMISRDWFAWANTFFGEFII